ncbi:hypothetical protein T4D_14944 [Trichinella pseudospiralis]|uniref:Uncharacterized protein n=1 Tax=Trichinella pseudospiralis TaxID=6337 RepID=A0A0V1FFK8_TRIPS|nr:hypothetical protein T4D_14944 [Trichinella pseudospiralis]
MNGICSILKNVILSNVGLYSLSENLRAIEICLPLRCITALCTTLTMSANDVRRMNNDGFNAMADEEY